AYECQVWLEFRRVLFRSPELNNRTDATSCGSAGLPPPVGGDPPQAASSTTPRALSGSRVRIVPIMYTRLRSAGFLVLARRGSAAQAAGLPARSAPPTPGEERP